MKEIKYEGDLEKDIEGLKLEPWSKDSFKKSFLASYCFDNLMVFFMAFIIFLVKVILDINMLSFFSFDLIIFCCSSLLVTAPIAYIQTKIDKKNHELKEITSSFNINKLSHKLKNNKELKININSSNLKKAVVKEEKDVVETYTVDEKIVKYFYLLDRNDQIQVLKQIREKTKKKANSQLYLLEEEDKENIKMPEKTMKLEFK